MVLELNVIILKLKHAKLVPNYACLHMTWQVSLNSQWQGLLHAHAKPLNSQSALAIATERYSCGVEFYL